jgi:toxin ParE1/3/4
MRLRFTPQATADLRNIADFMHERNPAAALRVRVAILESVGRLVEFPKSGRMQTVAGVRKVVTRRYPYLVYYTIDGEAAEVVVLAIQHPARERSFGDA